MEFTQYSCPVCGKRFVNGDDVVVCPECGTPHHRECWEQNGNCFYEDKHAEGFSFDNSETADGGAENGNELFVTCPQCGKENEKTNFYCDSCGFPLNETDRQQNPYQQPQNQNRNQNQNQAPFGGMPVFDPLAGLNSEDEIAEGVKVGEAAKYIGKNTPYYLMVFNRLKTTNTGKFNLSAFLFSGAFFLYRKMYALGIVLTLLMIGLTVGSTYLMMTPGWRDAFTEVYNASQSVSLFGSSTADSTLLQISGDKMVKVFILSALNLAPWVIMLICGFTANRLYYGHCAKTIRQIKQETDAPMLHKTLEEKGGVNLAMGVSFFAAIIIIREICGYLSTMWL